MINLIERISRILNACKGFDVGYSSNTICKSLRSIEGLEDLE